MNALLLEEHIRFEKIAVSSLYFSLAVVIFSGSNLFLNNQMFAQEANLTQNALLNSGIRFEQMPSTVEKEISIAAKRKEWEKEIRQKYQK